VRYFESGMLQTNACTRCGGRFVAHAYELRAGYVCGLCQPPSRAGKTRKAIASSGAAERAPGIAA
jgi:flagellar transcriptional activator FlhC